MLRTLCVGVTWVGLALLVVLPAHLGAAPAEGARLREAFKLRGEDAAVAMSANEVSVFSHPRNVASFTESRRLAGDRWKATVKHLDEGAAVLPGFCDRLNQINDPEEISGVLPRGANVKQIIRLAGKTLVLYAASDEALRYPLRIAVLEGTFERYRLLQTVTVSEEGFFCGAHVVASEKMLHLVVLVDEPAGSSNYLAVQGYSVAP